MLTGVSIQASHYHWYITKPLIGIVVAMYAGVLVPYILPKLRPAFLVSMLIVIGLLYNAALEQVTSYQAQYEAAVASQRYAPLFAYLKTLPPQTVWASEDLAIYLPIYTSDNAPNSTQLQNYLLPDSYLPERLFLTYRLRGISAQDALPTMQHERAQVSSDIYALYWRQQKSGFESIPDTILESLAQTYATKYANAPLKGIFADLGITMIVWDTTTNPEWDISSLPFVQKLYTSGTLEVYKIVQ